jgi:hypothetical protein
MYQWVEFTREELYEMVWSRPPSIAAKEIGVSAFVLALECKRAGIPLPSRGHWATATIGHPATSRPLPGAKSGQPTVVRFSVLAIPPAWPPKISGPAVHQIGVPRQLRKPHRLVTELKAAAKSTEEDNGVLALNYSNVLRIRASRRQLPRALILMDTLIKGFERCGYAVRIGERSETELILKEGVIPFRLDERTKRTTPPPTPHSKGGRHSTHHETWRPAFVLVATGEFTLSFQRYRLVGCRHTWRDRTGIALEAQLNQVMETIPSWEAALKARRLECEDQDAKAREAEALRVSRAREQEVLRRQRARLVSHLSSWERAERLRRFVAAVQAAGGHNKKALAWVEWANAQVLALDPLCPSHSAVTDLEINLEHHFTGSAIWEKPTRDWWNE